MLICFVAVMATKWYTTIFVFFYLVSSSFFLSFFFSVSLIINIIIFSRAH